MQREQLEYALKLMKFLEDNPLPEDSYFTPLVVIKDIETDLSYGNIHKDETGNYSYNI